MKRPGRRHRVGGFTLIEMIVVIVVIGVIGAIVAVFIRAPVQSYADSVARAELGDEADLALRRIGRDIRRALPNSVRVSDNGSSIEFLLTKAGGRYLSPEDEVSGAPVLDFLDPAHSSFMMLGTLTTAIDAGDYIVVNNLGAGMAPADAWQLASSQRNIAAVKLAVSAGSVNPVITLVDNPFAQQAVALPSPGLRFHVVSGAVAYRCGAEASGLVLRRYSDYPIGSIATAAGGRSAVIATRLASCEHLFEYDNIETRRSALVLMALALRARNDAGAVLRLVQQIHVDNTP